MGHCQLWSLRDRAVVCLGKIGSNHWASDYVALTSVQDLIEEYAELFSDNLGTVKRPPVVLHTDGSIPPIQMNAIHLYHQSR
ncbi:hypothetical protein T06_3937 [Trichinella sp. T6]|nr:hypothetical protein T06_3937 [Trichinella sp. T6]